MNRIIARHAIAAAALTMSAPVFAQTTIVAIDVPAWSDAMPAVAAQDPGAFGASALADDSLQAIAGRADLNQVSQSANTSTVANNSVGDNSRTGDARIADNAFQNLSGLSLLNVNTGNNVAINSAMNVTIAITPVN